MTILVIVIWVMLSRLTSTTEAVSVFLYNGCSAGWSPPATFTPNSTYQSNLNLLLSFLTSNASRADVNNGFYNTTVGRGLGAVVYGYFLCRGDVNAATCQECVSTANTDLVQTRCPTSKVAVIWYDHCMVRYANDSFFGKLDPPGEPVDLVNLQDITDPNRFFQLVTVTVNDTVSRAVSGGAKKFATKEASFTADQSLYTLAQCTPDISSSDCENCLEGFLPRIGDKYYGKRGGKYLKTSCYIRFEVYPFYDFTATPAPTPSITRSQGKDQNSTKVIVFSIAAPIAVLLFLLVGYNLLRRRARDMYNAAEEGNDGNEITTSAESLQFDLGTIKLATNNFSGDNKLGDGGFGEVYKGTLPNGQVIAAKRLSRGSRQGAEEFRTEAELAAKLQHKNLVIKAVGILLGRR